MDDTFYLEHKDKGVTLAEITAMDPDNINCAEFWERIVKDDFRPFCPLAKTKEDVNYYNSKLLHVSGFSTLFAEINPYVHLEILDIGAGLNCVGEYMKNSLGGFSYNYYPSDIVKHTPETILIEDGRLPASDGCINMVVSSNVFQHLGQDTITQYFKEISRITGDVASLFIGLVSKPPYPSGTLWCEEIQNYCTVLDNQPIPVYNYKVFVEELKEYGFGLYLLTQRMDGYVGMWFRKLKKE